VACKPLKIVQEDHEFIQQVFVRAAKVSCLILYVSDSDVLVCIMLREGFWVFLPPGSDG